MGGRSEGGMGDGNEDKQFAARSGFNIQDIRWSRMEDFPTILDLLLHLLHLKFLLLHVSSS